MKVRENLGAGRPFNPVIADVKRNQEHISNDEKVKVLVTEMHEMIRQILQNQNQKYNELDNSESIAKKSVKQTGNNLNNVEPWIVSGEFGIQDPNLSNNYFLSKVNSNEDKKNQFMLVRSNSNESSSEDIFQDKLNKLIATIERIKRNPILKGQEQQFSPSPQFDPDGSRRHK